MFPDRLLKYDLQVLHNTLKTHRALVLVGRAPPLHYHIDKKFYTDLNKKI